MLFGHAEDGEVLGNVVARRIEGKNDADRALGIYPKSIYCWWAISAMFCPGVRISTGQGGLTICMASTRLLTP